MKVPFLSSEAVLAEYPVNMYFVPQSYNGRDMMNITPGLTEWADTGLSDVIRGMIQMGSYLYVIVKNKCIRYTSAGSGTTAAANLDTSSGYVQMVQNGSSVMVVDGVSGYTVIESGGLPVLAKITDVDFEGVQSLTYQDGYGIAVKSSSGEFQISGLYDFTTWDALDYATAEGYPDNVLCAVSSHRELWLFGASTTEVWYNSGDADFPFARISGAYLEIGVGAVSSVVKMDNSIIWLADDWTIRRAEGYNPKVISPSKLGIEISGYTTKDDAIAYRYSDYGQEFYVICFPTEEKTWVLNLATGFWHQWASGTTLLRHRSNCYFYFADKHLVGDFENGKIYYLDSAEYTDNSSDIKRVMVSAPIVDDSRRNLFYERVEVEHKAGVGTYSTPKSVLQWSDDGGRTWSNEHTWRSAGKLGEYSARTVWRRLGRGRHRIFKWWATDPVDWTVVGVYADIKLGAS